MKLNVAIRLAMAAMAATPLGATLAEDSAPAAIGLEEIVVRATRHEESAQTIALTVNAFSADDLGRLGVADTPDIAAQVPNMQVNVGIGLNAFNVRGIGSNDFQTNVDSPIAVHVDEVYLSKTFMTKMFMFDIESVEVAKGPQGTLNGRNTTGGAVNFYTRGPSNVFGAGATVSYGNYETKRVEAYVTGPLGESLSGRISALVVDQGDGYYRNLTIGGTEGRDDYYALRGQLKWQGESTTVHGTAHFGRDKGTLAPYDAVGIYTPDSFAALNPAGGVAGMIGVASQMQRCPEYAAGTVTGATANCVRGHDGLRPGDDDPFTSNGHDYHVNDNTSYGGLLRVEHDLGAQQLTSITAYEYFERDTEEVGDNSPLYTGTWIFWYSKIKQFTQEFRLTSADDGPWKYVVGAFYQHDSLKTRDYLTLGFGTTPGLGGFDTDFQQKVDAAALFVHNEFAVTPTISLVAGARYNREKTKIVGGTCFAAGIANEGKIQVPTSGCLAQLSSSDAIVGGNSRTDKNGSFKVGVQWKPELSAEWVDDLMIYATASTGFRSGGFNADLATDQESFNSLSPEEITAYEIGFKSMLAGNRLRLNAALFHYDFKNGFINVDRGSSPVPFTINAAGITTDGLDLDLQWSPIDGLRFTAGVGWLDARINTDFLADGRSIDGNRPVNAPTTTLNASIAYDRPLTDGMTLSLNVSQSWRSKQYLETNNKPSDRQNAYGLLNAYVGLHGERWEVGVWGRNLTKKDYKTYVNDLPVFGWTLANYGAPRTYGVTLSMRL